MCVFKASRRCLEQRWWWWSGKPVLIFFGMYTTLSFICVMLLLSLLSQHSPLWLINRLRGMGLRWNSIPKILESKSPVKISKMPSALICMIWDQQLFLTLTFFVKTPLLTRKEFVDAYVNHVFNTSMQDVFEEFKRGFFQVCDSGLVQLFWPKELQGMLVGKDVYDWTKLKQVHSEKSHPLLFECTKF